MMRALALAERGWGRVHPNPMVGAVVVRNGEVVGEGWHETFGERHAEIAALAAAGSRSRGATLYSTLEPCVHTGKQPPCVPAIVAAGINRVVVALRDPNPDAAGGADALRRAGVTVDTGVGASDAARQNFRFLRGFASPARPFMAIKLAVSMDGCIADAAGKATWVSSPASQDWVHRLRAGFGAIAVGGRTAVADRSRLTVRGVVQPRVAPTRVVFDRTGVLPEDHPLFVDAATAPVVVINGPGVTVRSRAAQAASGVTVLVANELSGALHQLQRHGIDSMLVEGGGRLAGSLLGAGLVDRVYQLQCPVWLGAGVRAWDGLGAPSIASAIRWRIVDQRPIGEQGDVLIELEP